jgi:phage terminase large subunit
VNLPKFDYGGDALPVLKMDWKNPDYAGIFRARLANLERIRAEPERLPAIKAYYRDHPADFINDWGVTFDPRNAEIGLPTLLPFILFQRQREWIDWVLDRWRNRRPGLCEKSRDMGVTWEAVALSCTLCLNYDGLAIGFGSRKTEYVDKIGTMKPILPKARMFMEHLPEEFRGGYVPWRDGTFMRIAFPDTGSIIAGEGGDDIGRGDRTSIYFFDEEAHHPRQDLVAAALSQTTNCQISMSSVRGMNNLFAQKRWGGKIDVFIFDWHEDPRKDDAWYQRQCEDLDPVVVAQEIDRDYSASVKGVVIPGIWVRAAIDALKVLGIAPSGKRGIAFDVADEGEDKNAICDCMGIDVLETEEWSGKGGDIFSSTEYVMDVCEERGVWEFRYDADGVGADVRGDARVLNERRAKNRGRQVKAIGYRGSEGVYDPEGIVEGTIGREGDAGRTNLDYFGNHKAQAWWSLRKRFQKTYRWVQFIKTGGKEGIVCAADDIISLNSKNPNLMKLVSELSQATYRQNEVGKIIIEKTPVGMKSPNQADTVVIHYAPMEQAPVEITGDMLRQIAMAGGATRRR